jgi:hypothetical protein
VLGGSAVTATKTSSLVTATWASLTTGTKLAVVSVALVGGTYPAVSHWISPSIDSRTSPAIASKLEASPKSGDRAAPNAAARPAEPLAPIDSQPPAVTPLLPASVAPSVEAFSVKPLSVKSASVAQTARSVNIGTRTSEANQSVGHTQTVGATAPIVDLRLREETTLIERALVASRANDKVAAARWLGEHEQRFPSGVLVRERQRLQAALR